MDTSSIYFRDLYNTVLTEQEKAINNYLLPTSLFFSQLSYFSDTFIEKILLSLSASNVRIYQNHGIHSYLAEFDEFIILSFKGIEYKNIRDWIRIGSFHPVIYKNITAHRGFVKSLNYINLQILQDIDILKKEKRTIYTGHSLGGAIASLFLLDHLPTDIVTFGSPSISNDKKYKSHMEKINYKRVITENDLIRHLPMKFPFGYSHFIEPVIIPSTFSFKDVCKPHLLHTYMEGLMQLEVDK